LASFSSFLTLTTPQLFLECGPLQFPAATVTGDSVLNFKPNIKLRCQKKNRFARRLTVYRQTSTSSVKLVVGEGDVYTTPLLPGFELPLDRLLGRADLWA